VSIARWNLKEAGGKVPSRRTETAYKAKARRTSFLNKTKSKDWRGRKQTPALLPEPCNVNAAVARDEGYWLLPGEVWMACTRIET